MIKKFTLNDNNKIEMTKEELKKLLDEIYWEGYRANSDPWIYTTPCLTATPTDTIPSWFSCSDNSLTLTTSPLNSITTNTVQASTES